MERRKFNLSAWVAVGLTGFLAIASTISAFSVTKYKAETFEKQAETYHEELIDFQKMYREDQRRTTEQLTDVSNSIARIEQALELSKKK